MNRKAAQKDTGKRAELLMLRVMVHGPSAAFDEVEFLRALRWNEYTTWMEVAQVLRDVGMAEEDIWMLVNVGHPPGCCCWPCVGKLHAWVWRTRCARLAAS